MAALIRAAFCVAIPLLLLQLQAVCCNEEEAEAGAEPPKPRRTEPLSWDDLQYTRLQEINTVARKIQEAMKSSESGNPFAQVEAKIKPLRSAVQVENAVNDALSTKAPAGFKAITETVNGLLCSAAQRFKRQLKSVVSLAELIADTERPEFLEIIKGKSTMNDEKFQQAMKSLALNKEEGKSQIDIGNTIAKRVNPSEYGSNLYGRKTLAYKKLQVARNLFKTEENTIMDGANYALNSIYDAMLATKNIQRELKSTQEYPEDIAEEEARIKKALAVSKSLGCSKEKASGEKAKKEDDESNDD